MIEHLVYIAMCHESDYGSLGAYVRHLGYSYGRVSHLATLQELSRPQLLVQPCTKAVLVAGSSSACKTSTRVVVYLSSVRTTFLPQPSGHTCALELGVIVALY